MKGFTISGENGPVVSMGHAHGALISETAAGRKLLLACTDRCKTCGYRKVMRSKFVDFIHEVGRALTQDSAQGTPKQRFRVAACIAALMPLLDELETMSEEEIEILDDYVYCDAHAYR